MIELLNTGAYLVNGIDIIPDTEEGRAELEARTGARVRTGKIPGTVRADQLPQLPLRSRRNHQRR